MPRTESEARNSDRYVAAYNRIDEYLRRLLCAPKSVPFSTLLRRAADSSSAVRSNLQDLQEFSDLRNAIVHERTDGHTIAEPHTDTVRTIERLADMLTKPPIVADLLKGEVRGLDIGQTLADALTTMADKQYSQIPVTKGGAIFGVLSTNTVSCWLANKVGDGIVDLRGATISNVLSFAEEADNFALVSRQADIYEALALFEDALAAGRRLDAVIVTQNGRKTERPLRIATIADIPRLMKAVALSI